MHVCMQFYIYIYILARENLKSISEMKDIDMHLPASAIRVTGVPVSSALMAVHFPVPFYNKEIRIS